MALLAFLIVGAPLQTTPVQALAHPIVVRAAAHLRSQARCWKEEARRSQERRSSSG